MKHQDTHFASLPATQNLQPGSTRKPGLITTLSSHFQASVYHPIRLPVIVSHWFFERAACDTGAACSLWYTNSVQPV